MSSPPTIIAGWSTADRVPGVAEETIFAAGAISIGQLPVVCLITGTKGSGGTATPNQDIVQIYSADDADAKLQAGYEAAEQAYAALGQNQNLTLYWAGPPEANGATAATALLIIGGTWSSSGQLGITLDGQTFSPSVAATDTPATFAANIVTNVNSNPRGFWTAAAAAGPTGFQTVTFTSKSKGIRQNDHALYIDATKLPSGCTATIQGLAWSTSQTWLVGQLISPKTANGFIFKCTTGGAGSASTEPTWPTTLGTTVTDGAAVWTCWAPTLTAGGVRFQGGSGQDSLTTLMPILFSQEYGYIASAQYDATNAAAWKTQINNKAAPTENRIDRVIMAQTNGLTAAESLGQTTCNDFRMQTLWHQNSEWTPAKITAAMAGARASTEPQNPSAIYDGLVLVGCPGQRSSLDIPAHTTQATAILNSVTPVTTVNGQAQVVMSVTTYSLFGSTPDYRCLQTYYEVVPDTIRKDVGLQWLTGIKPANPHVADDPAPSQKDRPAGVFTPSRATSFITSILRDYERAGHIIDVGLNPPQSGFDSIAKRIVSVIPVKVTPGNHQFGISVRQLAA